MIISLVYAIIHHLSVDWKEIYRFLYVDATITPLLLIVESSRLSANLFEFYFRLAFDYIFIFPVFTS